MRTQRGARVREPRAAAAAHEQRRAEAVLECGDERRHRRLRLPRRAGGGGEPAGVGDGEEGPQPRLVAQEVHGTSLWDDAELRLAPWPPKAYGASMTPAREWHASSYDVVAAPMTTRGIALVDGLDLRGDETVLDAGCGTGQVTEHLLERLPSGRVIALDGSADMLRVAAERLGHDRVSYVQADLELPLALDAPVDLVVSTSTFHWVRDHDALWRHLAAVLVPGGALAAEFGGEGNIASIRAVIGEDDTWTFAGEAQTLERLAAAGFTDATAQLLPKPAAVPPEQLEEYLRTVVLGVHLDGREPADADAEVRRVAAALPEPVIDYVRLVVHARKAT